MLSKHKTLLLQVLLISERILHRVLHHGVFHHALIYWVVPAVIDVRGCALVNRSSGHSLRLLLEIISIGSRLSRSFLIRCLKSVLWTHVR